MRRRSGALDRLSAGAGGFIEVVGEAGIGKSRLLAAVRGLAEQLRGAEAQDASAQHESPSAPPHGQPEPSSLA